VAFPIPLGGCVPIPPVGPGGRGRSPLDPAHQPEADAGRVEDMPEPSRVRV